MANLTYSNIKKKEEELPPCGFILQKDVYTTNLLYANDQFPLKSLRKRLPFRHKSSEITKDPSHSVRIIKLNGENTENSEKKNSFYFKTKQLKFKKLKFPLPKIKALPLTNLNLYQEINNRNVKIKNMDDDLNITSSNGKKIVYKFKENKLTNYKKCNFPSIFKRKINRNNRNLKKCFKKKENNISMDKMSLKYMIRELNNEIKNIKQSEKEWKRSFIKDKFFSTQIYVENVIDSKNKAH